MPVLDANTMNWLTGIFAPLLAALVAAGVGALAALYATRWEATRAEDRAKKAEIRADRIRDLTDTYDAMMRSLYQVMNLAKPEDQIDLAPDPVSVNYPLIGDPDGVVEYMKLLVSLTRRPAHSGISKAEMAAFGNVVDRLRVAATHQRDLIRAGHEPVVPATVEAGEIANELWQRL